MIKLMIIHNFVNKQFINVGIIILNAANPIMNYEL